MQKIEKYGMIELELGSGCCTEPLVEFKLGEETQTVKGFLEDDKCFVRFMPQMEGIWQFKSICGGSEVTGEFECVKNTGINHGSVVADGFHLKYADGTRYFCVGTTCYAWIHQTPELITQTYETLPNAPFNKMRMCVFPKHMPFNNNEPELFPFHKKEDGSWDVNNPDSKFWRFLEDSIKRLGEMGIEVDLILFHPYDRWGFSKFSLDESLTYLDYCIRRLSAFRNIWWSIANEYDLVPGRSIEYWDTIGERIYAEDIYKHMLSNHNCFATYPKRDWMTHRSIQSGFVRRVGNWRMEYELPVLIDECGYEGDIEFDWGNLSAFEMVNRFWICNTLGGYCTHGETFNREDEILWWAKGGVLHGESPKRIAFMKNIFESIGDLDPVVSRAFFDPNNTEIPPEYEVFVKAVLAMPEHERNEMISGFSPIVGQNDDYKLQYLARTCPSYMNVKLPENGKYKIEVIDVWEMTRITACEDSSGTVRINLPGKEGIAVLISRLEGESLKDAPVR